MDKRFASINKVTILYGCAVALVQECHKKFNLTYASNEYQDLLFQRLCQNINRYNPLVELSFNIDITEFSNDDEWEMFKLSEIHNLPATYPITIPQVQDPNDAKDIIAFCGGPYKLEEALQYISLCRRYQLEQRREAVDDEGDSDDEIFNDLGSYLEAAKDYPDDYPVYIRYCCLL